MKTPKSQETQSAHEPKQSPELAERKESREPAEQKSRITLSPWDLKDPVEAAKAARLKYVTDDGPCIRRRRAGKGFVYLGIDGKPIHDPEVVQRIKSLGIP